MDIIASQIYRNEYGIRLVTVHVSVAKFGDHLPAYRLEGILNDPASPFLVKHFAVGCKSECAEFKISFPSILMGAAESIHDLGLE